IRDATVTGVQTCALPISVRGAAAGDLRRERGPGGTGGGPRGGGVPCAGRRRVRVRFLGHADRALQGDAGRRRRGRRRGEVGGGRSEERRVGRGGSWLWCE